MTREFTNKLPQRLPACNFLSQYYFYNISLQKSCIFSLQTLAKFEAPFFSFDRCVVRVLVKKRNATVQAQDYSRRLLPTHPSLITIDLCYSKTHAKMADMPGKSSAEKLK